MLDYRITFESPWYLTLLALLPVLWWYSYRRLALLGRFRRLLALNQPLSASAATSLPLLYSVAVPARQQYSHSASVGRRYS